MRIMRKIWEKPKGFGIYHDCYSRTDPVKAVEILRYKQHRRGYVGLPVDLGGQPGLTMFMKTVAVVSKLSGPSPIPMLEDAAISLMQVAKGHARFHRDFWIESLRAEDATPMNSQGCFYT